MKKTLHFAAVLEVATGLALLIVPTRVGQLLLGEQLTGTAIDVGRVAGIALLCLGIACWTSLPLGAMLAYNVLIMLYLAYLGVTAGTVGILLWPAVVLHVVLSVLLGRGWLTTRT